MISGPLTIRSPGDTAEELVRIATDARRAIVNLEHELAERDRMIHRLRSEVTRLQRTKADQTENPPPDVAA